MTKRLDQRGALLDTLTRFAPESWELVSAEVRTDTGKCAKSTWRVQTRERFWWVVIGLGVTLVTVSDVDPLRQGRGEHIVTGGRLYARVDAVNVPLMRGA
ncbi:hypothetical protein ACFYTV_04000 [Streptomyces sp. NPDC004562]|uniref:hypothetical protein n=1 Tax=Streptomyces sp. NPDC004562 TaxID=3364703 RepID=UPI00367E8E28